MTIMIPIDKGIPCPPWNVPKRNKPRSVIRQWRKMEIGDSFFEAAEGRDLQVLQVRICAAAAGASARLNRRFETRLVEGGVRVWRTK